MPCTTLLVGKKASYDGSTIVARNEDSGGSKFTPKNFTVVHPEDQPRRYTSVISHLTIDLPDNPLRYTSMPNALPGEGIWGEAGVNSANVTMSATETLTTNERVLGADPFVEYRAAKGVTGEEGYEPEAPGGIGEEDMLTIVLPYIRSAREGVQRLGSLLEQYGTYEMNGISFSDVDEIWWLETVGGHHWIARRVPDDCYATVPNQLGLDVFDLEDALGEQRDFMCSADLREFMASNHLDLTFDSDDADEACDGTLEDVLDEEPGVVLDRAFDGLFNPREAFGSHSDSDHIYNTPRAWAMQRFLNPQDEEWDGPDATCRPEDDDIPWCRIPERKLTIEDVKYALSLHYQGTPFDPYGRKGDERTRGCYRPIGINRNGQLAVLQVRPYAPESLRVIQWVAYGSNPFNTLAPFYANVEHTPEYLSNTTARVSTDCFYWANRLIAGLADPHFNECAPDIERYQLKTGGFGHRLLRETDAQVGALAGATAGADSAASQDVRDALAAANDRMADELRKRTDDLLDKVLLTSSQHMRNAFSRSDG